MNRLIFTLILFACLVTVTVTVQAQESSIKTDILMERITSLIDANKHAQALRYFAELEATGTSLPQSFYYFYIDALDKAGVIDETVQRGEAFLNQYGKKSKYYSQVVSIVSRRLIDLEGPRKIGEKYQGGIIFHVYDSGKHGLIASLADQSSGIIWHNGKAIITGATDNGIGAGAANTRKIIAAQGPGVYAAQVAADFKVQGNGTTPCSGTPGEICYRDWYLPSISELNLLYDEENVVPGFASKGYCSSTEIDAYSFRVKRDYWYDDLEKRRIWYTDYEKRYECRVRAIRAF